MISRKTVMAIAEAYVKKFSLKRRDQWGHYYDTVYVESLYDFLYELEYQAWFCNLAKSQSPASIRGLKEWLLKIHTGESLSSATKSWSWPQREKLGQEYLRDLAGDILREFAGAKEEWRKKEYAEFSTELIRRLELDGYVYHDGELRQSEIEVLDVEAETGVLHSLHQHLRLENEDATFTFLRLSEEHYVAGRWPDAIGNARKFFEAVLQNVVVRFAAHRGTTIATRDLERPVFVRDFLEREELLEKRERETVDKVYGLLSHTGGHPYMAEQDQARLLRQLSLTLAQFVMLRLGGAISSEGK